MSNRIHCLISAGPTREWIDRVRYISNPSSGKMGFALANAAVESGMEVTLVTGPVAIPPPKGLIVINVETAIEMNEVMLQHFKSASLIIMSAAVCDHRPALSHETKIKKEDFCSTLELEKNPDILMNLGKIKMPTQTLVGFAAETDNHVTNAVIKLEQKNLDWVALNDVSKKDSGFQSDKNSLTMISRNDEKVVLKHQSKISLARKVIDLVLP